MSRPPRVLVAFWPDWPVLAAGFPPDVPAVVVFANRVVAVTAAARREGVERGLRRREAQGRCSGLEVVAADPGRDARAWEPVVAAVEKLTTAVEVTGPGALGFGTRGPSRYFGGDAALAARVRAVVEEAVAGVAGPNFVPVSQLCTENRPERTDRYRVVRSVQSSGAGGGRGAPGAGGAPAGPVVAGGGGCRVGVADGRFTAGLAARVAPPEGLVIPAGGSREWLAPQPVRSLGPTFEELADLLVRLGIRTLGDLAALPGPAVLGRFGPEGVAARRLARGLDERAVQGREPPPDLSCSAQMDPPEQRVEAAAFVAKSLADELNARLDAAGLVTTMVAIEVETEHGEHLVRHWRHEGALSAVALAERTRWQLDGWLSGAAAGVAGVPTGGITLLRLTPLEVRPDTGRQMGFWGGTADSDARATRALARVQGLLGPEAVVTAVVEGGRGLAEQVRLVPWGDAREAAGRPAPWPGRLGHPSPAIVHRPPRTADICDPEGRPVEVSGRGLLSATPAALAVEGGPLEEILHWAGPWPLEERWWEAGGRRRARLQVEVAGGVGHVVYREAGGWWVEATYG